MAIFYANHFCLLAISLNSESGASQTVFIVVLLGHKFSMNIKQALQFHLVMFRQNPAQFSGKD